jgi:hypothetical protein
MKENAKDVAAAMMREVARRRIDYSEHDYVAERSKLIAEWRAAHPECASEPPSKVHHTLDQIQKGQRDNFEQPEIWENDVYQVTVRRWTKDPVFGRWNGGMIQIGINALDGTARHDWREFQMIKNQIAGDECEAFELYPAESRLMDPSNYYTLWCFPGLRRIKVGIDEGRRVFNADEAIAPQRGFEVKREPRGTHFEPSVHSTHCRHCGQTYDQHKASPHGECQDAFQQG